ncbi:LOW QUALITY PROTEIN: histone-lysine N-methyltransferase SETMAR [Plakobranchus ocellatus]|uniref:Histone-lysine N-methyltransferase SETMAR n=1 Tax=Plakobranchus ocellatus TaxID=259542 RepID=A0AAV4CH91_9GAST|nr:LOW QUALITY PROTEIN: histone-lysine N-methyltransferase SETMAR [Plakobranchus ocellatus]
MSMTQVYQWCFWFKDGRTSLQDEPRSGRPNTTNNDWNTARVDELIKVDRRVKLKEISLILDIPKTNVYEIVHDKLGYCKVSARWVPKMLSDEHKHQRVEISQILLHRCQQEGDETVDVGPRGDHCARNKLLEHLITGDETCLHLSTPETKHDSMTRKHPSSPVTKKFKVQQSATKVMATMFWDSCGMILLNILPKGESANADRYCETLDRLRHAVRRKRPGLLRAELSLNTTMQPPPPHTHTAKRTKEWLERYRWDIIPHPAHSSYLAPLDFYLFGPLKRHLGGKSLRMKMNSLVKFVIGFQSLTQTFLHRVYTRSSHGGKNA